MRILLAICVAAFGLITTACFGCDRLAQKASERATEKLIESASGGDVDVDLKDGGFTITGEDGEMTTQFGSDASLPADWPGNIPQYPGSTIVSSHSTADDEAVYMGVSLTTGDAMDEVMAFYEGRAGAAGYESKATYNAEEMSNHHFASPEYIFNVSCGRNEQETIVTLSVQTNTDEGDSSSSSSGSGSTADGAAVAADEPEGGDGKPDDSPVVTDTTGSLPDGFPVQVLKPYGNGKVTTASMTDSDVLLIQETADSRQDVIAFYDAHLTGRGWAVDSKVEVQGTSLHGYKSSGGEILLTAVDGQQGATQISLVYSIKGK